MVDRDWCQLKIQHKSTFCTVWKRYQCQPMESVPKGEPPIPFRFFLPLLHVLFLVLGNFRGQVDVSTVLK